jgi:multidrug transporter EmrE-like cation transporter
MNLASFTLILTGVLLNAFAQLSLKAAVRHLGPITLSRSVIGPVSMQLISEPGLWAGLGAYGVSVLVWIVALSRVDVSIAYPMLSIGYIVNAIAAWWLFGEALGPARFLGIGLIVLGVVVLSRG